MATGRTRPFLPGERFVEAIAKSPDSGKLAFSRAVAALTGSGDKQNVDCHDGQLIILDLKTKARRIWEAPGASVDHLRWSPDGTQLAYTLSPRDLGGVTDAARSYLLDLATSNGPRLAGRLLAAPSPAACCERPSSAQHRQGADRFELRPPPP